MKINKFSTKELESNKKILLHLYTLQEALKLLELNNK